MARIIETRSRGGVPTTMTASPQTGVLAPMIPFDPRPVPVNDGGSGQGMNSNDVFDLGGSSLAGGINESGASGSWIPGADALSNVLDWGTELARTLKLVGGVITQVIMPAFWIRLALFNIGLVMIVGGTALFAKG